MKSFQKHRVDEAKKPIEVFSFLLYWCWNCGAGARIPKHFRNADQSPIVYCHGKLQNWFHYQCSGHLSQSDAQKQFRNFRLPFSRIDTPNALTSFDDKWFLPRYVKLTVFLLWTFNMCVCVFVWSTYHYPTNGMQAKIRLAHRLFVRTTIEMNDENNVEHFVKHILDIFVFFFLSFRWTVK